MLILSGIKFKFKLRSENRKPNHLKTATKMATILYLPFEITNI